jgi:aldose 1-epimerase
MVLFSAAAKLWQTESAIPTGQLVPVPAELVFRQPRPIERTHFDTLLGDLGANSDENGLTIATLGHIQQPGVLEVKAPALFRELVLFIPPHRRAVAIEPYTCATDAPNLTARGIDAGWQTLAPHKVEQTWVEYRWHPDRTGSLFASSAP